MEINSRIQQPKYIALIGFCRNASKKFTINKMRKATNNNNITTTIARTTIFTTATGALEISSIIARLIDIISIIKSGMPLTAILSISKAFCLISLHFAPKNGVIIHATNIGIPIV